MDSSVLSFGHLFYLYKVANPIWLLIEEEKWSLFSLERDGLESAMYSILHRSFLLTIEMNLVSNHKQSDRKMYIQSVRKKCGFSEMGNMETLFSVL